MEMQTTTNKPITLSGCTSPQRHPGMWCATWTRTIMFSRKHKTGSPANRGGDHEGDLTKAFHRLTVNPRTEDQPNNKFIGGFPANHPETPPKNLKPPPPPSLRPGDGRVPPPRRQSSGGMGFPVPMHVTPPPPVLHEFTPFQMPTPHREDSKQSLTMRYAQQDFGPPVPPKDFPQMSSPPNAYQQGDPSALDRITYQLRPGSDTNLPRPYPGSLPSTPAKPGKSPGLAVDTSPIDKRKRGSSEPPSPSDEKKDKDPSEIQCSGQTKAGKRCTRVVKVGPPLAIVHPDTEDLERFCFQHTKEVFSQSGFYLKRTERDEFIKFEGARQDEISKSGSSFLTCVDI